MNTPEINDEMRDREVHKFLANMLGMTDEEYEKQISAVDNDVKTFMSAELPIRPNEPEFWADVPWRIEPDQDSIPMLFIIREANLKWPAKGPWRLDTLKVEQRLADKTWHVIDSFSPKELPGVDEKGNVETRFWTHRIKIPLKSPPLKDVKQDVPIYLRAVFIGSFYPFDETEAIEIPLETCWAQQALPLSRAAQKSGPRYWFYGDTHYHSSYTDDIKEFGNPVLDTCKAGQAMGLDWLIITDHSCDLDEVDEGYGGKTRWERLKADLSSTEISNEAFRCILGEEITLASSDGKQCLHMLVFGSVDEMIPGGFLPAEGEFEGWREIIKWFLGRAADNGHPADTFKRLFSDWSLDKQTRANCTWFAENRRKSKGKWLQVRLGDCFRPL